MNETTIALLDRLEIDIDAMDAAISFYGARSEETFSSGRWGAGYAAFLETVVHEADYESPDCPEGWDTFWGHLARTDPGVLALMDQLPEAADSDEAMLDMMCQQQGIPPRIVSAGAWLTRNGVFSSKAYPLHVLEAHAGVGA